MMQYDSSGCAGFNFKYFKDYTEAENFGKYKMMRATLLLGFIFSLLVIISCGNVEKNPSLATFTGGKITQEDYIDLYLRSTQYKPDVFPTEDNLLSLVHRLAMEEISVLESTVQRIDTTSLYNKSFNNSVRKVLFQQYVSKEMIEKVISDSLVRRFYENLTPQYRMAYIMRPFDETSPESFITSQKDSIEYIYALLRKGEDFKEVATKYSQEITSKEKGGDIGFVIRESLGDIRLREEMDKLKQFAISKPFRGFSGYYILYKGEKRDVSVPPFEEAAAQIWETLYRTRKHDIKGMVAERLNKLKPVYHYKIDNKNIQLVLKRAGKKRNSKIYDTLQFSKLDHTDMQEVIARYDGGEIHVYEIFPNPKTDPINEYEFMKDLTSVSEKHLFALEAKKSGMEKLPDVEKELIKIHKSIMRNLYYQREVRDKARAKTDSIQSEKTEQNASLKAKNTRAQYFAIEREMKEIYEDNLKEKYHFKYIDKYFDQALNEASKRKVVQNKEREEIGKK